MSPPIRVAMPEPKTKPKKTSRFTIGDCVVVTSGLTKGAKGTVCAVKGKKVTLRQLNGNLINTLEHHLAYDK